MNEAAARDWVRERFGVSRETLVARFATMVIAENAHQNLIANSTISDMWNRHVLDSAQLVPLADGDGLWVDIGSGAGFPGLVVALLTERPVLLIEPRARRAAFLKRVADDLGLAARVEVAVTRVEAVQRRTRRAAVISARAVAKLDELLESASHLSTRSTTWLLPKGKNAQSEVEAAQRSWQGVFHVEPSLTQPESWIVVAREIRR